MTYWKRNGGKVAVSPKTAKGIPLPVWIGAGLLAVVVGYFFLRTNSTSATQGAAGTTDATTGAGQTYAAYLNQSSLLNMELQNIQAELQGIASTQGASAPPNPSPPPPPNPEPDCCPPGRGILCRVGMSYCPPSLVHDGSGVISPAQLAKV